MRRVGLRHNRLGGDRQVTLKVLVADDHAINRLLLRTLFESFGCAVATVASGAEALEIDEDFDLICVDRHMPHMGGEELVRRLGSGAFVVACTSHPANLAGAFKMVIEKPIDCHAVAAVVAAARTWRLAKSLGTWSPAKILRERRCICSLAAAHPEVETSMTESVRLAAIAAARTWKAGVPQVQRL
jgi:CheY-like chemotaxis protein